MLKILPGRRSRNRLWAKYSGSQKAYVASLEIISLQGLLFTSSTVQIVEQRARVLRAIDSGRYETTTLIHSNHFSRYGPAVDSRWRGRDDSREDGRWRRDTGGYGANQHRQDYSKGHGNARSYRR